MKFLYDLYKTIRNSTQEMRFQKYMKEFICKSRNFILAKCKLDV